MARIEETSHKVSDIIGVIDEIARQTNCWRSMPRMKRHAPATPPRLCRGGLGGALSGAALGAGR